MPGQIGDDDIGWAAASGGGGGSGTVTSVATGTGLTGGTITTSGTISVAPGTANSLAGYNASGVFSGVTVGSGLTLSGGTLTASGGGSGTVTSVSVVSANGLAGSVATATTTPAITLSTSITGVLKGNGTAISAATAGTDYQAPITLTTTGTSGAATFISNTLNIPQYTGGGGSGITGLTGDVTTAQSTSGNVASFNFGQTQIITPTLTTSQNNWSPTGWLTAGVQVANQIKITNATSILSVTGLVPQTSGSEGSTVTIGVASGSTAFPIKLVANSASSTAANQFGFSGDVFIAPGEEVTLMYDAAASLWREKYGHKDWGQVYFGSGADGDTTISGTTTLARDMYYRNLTISGAGNKIITNTFRIYVSEVLDISGAIAGGIQLNGGAGGAGTGAGAAGSAGTRVFSGAVQLPIMTGGVVGATGTATNGNNGTAGTAGAITGQNSLAGGVGGTGAGGTAGNGGGAASSASNNGIVTAFNTQPYQDLASVAMNILPIGCSGGSGGGGSGDTANAGGGEEDPGVVVELYGYLHDLLIVALVAQHQLFKL